jgi:hypothetical protein
LESRVAVMAGSVAKIPGLIPVLAAARSGGILEAIPPHPGRLGGRRE